MGSKGPFVMSKVNFVQRLQVAGESLFRARYHSAFGRVAGLFLLGNLEVVNQCFVGLGLETERDNGH